MIGQSVRMSGEQRFSAPTRFLYQHWIFGTIAMGIGTFVLVGLRLADSNGKAVWAGVLGAALNLILWAPRWGPFRIRYERLAAEPTDS